MKSLTHPLLIAAAIATELLTTGWSASAAPALSSSLLSATSPTNHTVLIASRLGFRFRVRSSRFRRGGFSRGGSCSQAGSIVPLTPVKDSEGNALGDNAAAYLTAAAHPTFFFYVPTLPATKGILTLQRPDLPLTQQLVYQTDFNLNGQAGIVGIQLPDNAPSLDVGVQYIWRVSVACDPENHRDSLTAMGGVVQRVPGITGSPTEQLKFYQDQGIWQDTVALMATEVHNAPTNSAIANEFSTLLEEAGLDAIAHAPVIQISQGH
jgi:hypothetical protein